MLHLRLWCFQSTVVWEEKKFYLRLAQMNLKRQTARYPLQVIRFEQKFVLGC